MTTRFKLVVLVAFFASAASVHAQSKSMCKTFFDSTAKLHTRVECAEALFSDPKFHFTFSGLPPGNGFALGGMFEDEVDNISSSGKLSSKQAKLSIVGSVNQSWVASGIFDFTPPVYTPDRNKNSEVCQRLGVLCTKTQFSLHAQGVHRSLQTLSFYGLGPLSPALKHTFHQNDTFGDIAANLPLTDHFALSSGIEFLQPDLPPTNDPLSVSNSFTNLTAPGLQSQPFFTHTNIAIVTTASALTNPRTNDDPLNHTGPLMKRNIRFTFYNQAAYHWYSGVNNSSSSFQRFVFSGDESIAFGSNVRRYVTVADIGHSLGSRLLYRILQNACGNGHEKLTAPGDYVLKVTQQCNYGKFDFRSNLAVSNTGTGSIIPFYLQPTVGGSDINSQISLRGFPNYRFRDRNAVFAQVEYTVPIADPVGLLLFYDAGRVGSTLSDLTFSHLRQDAGFGATFSLQGNVVAQTYVAWGAGHGPTLNYNFRKLF
ncbi:hypothetical protein [Tunturibacter empetritectus]|uniref:Bacterial surface antigen (D15) domain-containing protein n=1 Tax=Tunturiibacter lichenicola TaxID=2051959 RepID=A0A7W8JBK2_9BACT|nr:hypothetical protein [Edaphobacter lichenicola]MBB5346290.1 hypothetical protein [Edaphobacter lichenicola]